VEDYLTSNLQAYFSEQERQEAEGMEECKNLRKMHGFIPDPGVYPEDTGFCDECSVFLSGKCTV